MGPFAPGSILIITTRDTTTLDKIQVEHSHQFEVNVMNDAEALKLFTAHAFPNAEADESLMALFGDDILSLAGNLPLALRVFGSHLYTKCKDGWEDYINKLKLNPNSTILDRLMISLDSMDDPILRNMFIDIACFFIGRKINEVVDIMKTYYSINVVHNIRALEKRSLITIYLNDVLGMHDLIRDMGWEAARNKFPRDEPENHTRLWVPDDICDVLQQDRGGEAIEGIIPSSFNYGDALKKSEFTTDAFKNMRKLRFLYIQDVKLTGRFEHIFGSLKWLCWGRCPLTELPSHFRPRKLVVLELHGSSIIKWDLKKDFEYLKTLDMRNSTYLTALPDLSKLSKLENLNLEGCESLKMLDISDGCLTKLVSLNLQGCVNLISICDRHCSLKALEVLDVSECEKLKSLPDNLWVIASFRELCTGSRFDKIKFESPFNQLILSSSTLTTLPSIMSQILNLESVRIFSSPNLVSLEHLPPTIERLSLHDCEGLRKLPDLSSFTKLQELSIMDCSGLAEFVGLEGLTCLEMFRCNSSHLGYTLVRRLVKMASRNAITIHTRGDIPDWMISGDIDKLIDLDWINRTDIDSDRVHRTFIAPDVQHNFLGIMLCFMFEGPESFEYDISIPHWAVTNVTTHKRFRVTYLRNDNFMMIILPASVISVTAGDEIVVRAARIGYLRGFQFMYDD